MDPVCHQTLRRVYVRTRAHPKIWVALVPMVASMSTLDYSKAALVGVGSLSLGA